ncbi:MAG: hypothetical protein R3B93_07760 [Bacteroidia bacterium]
MKYPVFLILITAFVLTSCFREDALLPPYQPDPEVKQIIIPMAEEDDIVGVVF